jgi:hypothetical protein
MSGNSTDEQLAERRQKFQNNTLVQTQAQQSTHISILPESEPDSDIEIVSPHQINRDAKHNRNVRNNHNTNGTGNNSNSSNSMSHRHHQRNNQNRQSRSRYGTSEVRDEPESKSSESRMQFLKNAIDKCSQEMQFHQNEIIRKTTRISEMELELQELQDAKIIELNGKQEADTDSNARNERNERNEQNERNARAVQPPGNASSEAQTPALVRSERDRIAKQEELDRELAVAMNATYEREMYNDNGRRGGHQHHQHHHRHRHHEEQRAIQPQQISFSTVDNGNGNRSHSSHTSFSFSSNGQPPMVVHRYSSSHHPSNEPFLMRFANNNHMNIGGGSNMDQFVQRHGLFDMHQPQSAFSESDLSAMGMAMGMNGLALGPMHMGANIDHLSYEQMQQMFPNLPRGANEEAIHNLPTDTFRESSNSAENQSAQANTANNNNSDSSSNNSTHNRHKKQNTEKSKCCICLEAFKTGEAIRRLPCMHIFHTEEIDHWLRINHVCPICRLAVDRN